MSTTTNTMTKPALPAHVGGERFASTRTFVDKHNDNQELPEIVSADEINWASPQRESIYSKYDVLQVGQAIGKLPTRIANTIASRLKRLGMSVQVSKVADGTYAIKRLA